MPEGILIDVMYLQLLKADKPMAATSYPPKYSGIVTAPLVDVEIVVGDDELPDPKMATPPETQYLHVTPPTSSE